MLIGQQQKIHKNTHNNVKKLEAGRTKDKASRNDGKTFDPAIQLENKNSWEKVALKDEVNTESGGGMLNNNSEGQTRDEFPKSQGLTSKK